MRMTFLLPVLLAATAYSTAPAAEQPQTITLSQALQRTLQHDTTLQAFPYQLRMAEAQQLQASIKPNPELDLSLENVLGTGDNRALKGAELTLSLSQQIELGQKRERRLELAQRQSQLQRDNYELARLDALAATTMQYVELLRLQYIQQWARERISRQQSLLATAELRSKAGNLLDADISRIKLRLLRSQLQLADIQQTIESRRYRLAARWHTTPDFARVTGDLALLPQVPALSALQQQLQQSAAMQRYITLQRIAHSQLRLTEANSQADVRFSAGLRRNQANNDNALVFSLSMPLTLTDPNEGRRLAQAADQALLARQQQLASSELSLLLHQQWLNLQQLRDTVQAINTRLLPEAEKLRQISLSSYQQGQLDLLSLLSAEEELAQAEHDLIQTQSRFHLTLLELERLTGQPMTLTTTASAVALEQSYE
ncbi:outer membrane protein, cobalt-zinc-cadmium efflux system [Arsukibacterium tuosuense]|uniref:Outer membrane protein, cobalt-zinc-cadmium efflux system n=1 Tax=Arsukibacterium tuosuense TaxID=1323745 RepID=A0A285I750_9GAMM|nr:TolC family protein [Arsukibacterium tuosuense]SNY43713.1 outer membrane protein, cobalt-zinc-cadmium efflux system [Arsukibacterium tuosuense]